MTNDWSLPHGTNGTLRLRLPDALSLPGRLRAVRLSFGIVSLVRDVPEVPHPSRR